MVALLVLAGHVAYGLAFELPVPHRHDEFAYLLTGETFAAGRLTNPPHPLWDHFETFHVLHQPTYQGKYPPGQGAFLALGMRLGHPALGVWLSLALAAGATCWALEALVPRAWAIGGTLLFAVTFDAFQKWGQTYWGGAVAMLGGALLFGGLARLRERPSSRPAWIMAAGLFLLANSRPFEGAISAALVLPLIALGPWRQAAASSRAAALRRVALPLAVAVLAVVAWTLYYNARVTGDPFLMPHTKWRAREAVNDVVQVYRGSIERSLPGKLQQIQQLYAGFLALAVPFLVLRLRSWVVGYACVLVAVPVAISIIGTRAYPHYVAPITVPIVLLLIESLRGLAGLKVRGRSVGAAAAALLIAVHVGANLYRIGKYVHDGPSVEWYRERDRLQAQLERDGAQHLILVRYGPDHDVHDEWVYNAADIDAAAVVWARDHGPEGNRDLLLHFRGRQVWTLEADESPRRLVQAP